MALREVVSQREEVSQGEEEAQVCVRKFYACNSGTDQHICEEREAAFLAFRREWEESQRHPQVCHIHVNSMVTL